MIIAELCLPLQTHCHLIKLHCVYTSHPGAPQTAENETDSPTESGNGMQIHPLPT